MAAWKNKSVLPGFGISLGVSILMLSLMVLLPFLMLVITVSDMGWSAFFDTITEPRTLAAVWLTLKVSFFAMCTNLVFGTLLAWILERYDFLGKDIVNALIDLPFALPTAVTGIALATLYSPNGWIGRWLDILGIQVAFTPLGIWIALIVVSLPMVVRSIQPVLSELPAEYEEAAVSLGANRWIIATRVILPEILPALIMGAGMAFARATGEYGSVIFIAGNIPMQSEILPLIIASKFELFDVAGASAVALFMLSISFLVLIVFNSWQWYLERRIDRG